jgi:hypothetical protein
MAVVVIIDCLKYGIRSSENNECVSSDVGLFLNYLASEMHTKIVGAMVPTHNKSPAVPVACTDCLELGPWPSRKHCSHAIDWGASQSFILRCLQK